MATASLTFRNRGPSLAFGCCGLVTVVMAEIMARTLGGTTAADVAELTNAALAEHQLAWRLVPVN